MDIIEHGTGGVGHVGNVDRAAGQLPQQPGVHRSEEDLAPAGPLPGTIHMIQDPFDLGAGEIGVGNQAGGFADMIPQPLLQQSVYDAGSTTALPHNGVADGAAGLAVPEDGGFTLIGDANGGNVGGIYAGLGDHLHHDRVLGGPDFHGVVFYPPFLGVDLGEFLLTDADDVLFPIKEDGAGTGGTLIQGEDVLFHNKTSQYATAFTDRVWR